VRAGAIKGERRSKRRGTSIEFADYRNYAPGDDLRRLDWNVYARLERPYVKLLEDEEDLAVHLLLDASASMDWPSTEAGDPAHNKLLFAKRIFAALGYISLVSNDRLLMTGVSGTGLAQFGPVRGRAGTVGMLKFAHELRAQGVTDLNPALKDYATRGGRPGLTILISDMFSPSGYVDGLNALLGRGYEALLIHVMSPDEVQPPLTGDLRLIDVESGAAQEISIDPAMRALYIERVEAWRAEIRASCTQRGVHYLPLLSDTSWERAILFDLRRLGLVK
jgi:uncharacterized protein (DUF58 family)